MDVPTDLRQRLAAFGQEHLLAFWNDLDEHRQARLAAQLERIDFEQLAALVSGPSSADDAKSDTSTPANRATAPGDLVRLPTSSEQQEWDRAGRRGNELLAAGRVGAILVAGGQGTRLGFDQPKGLFPIGPASGASLFEVLAGQILARGEQAGRSIPYYVMTSEATDAPTRDFFQDNDWFGLNSEDVFFFRQGNMPAVDARTGEILLAAKGRVAESPDGHGGIIAALKESGALADMARRGIEVLHYHQVDNPTAIVCDPAFLGWHALRGSEMSTKVVAKRDPAERMGVVCDVEGTTQIIEYSDLPAELADKRDAAGGPIFWAGNTAMHVLERSFLERLCDGEHDLPFHRAHKAVASLDDAGGEVLPSRPNAFKFERFIFDALPQAQTALVVEADRDREFHPVKNAKGADSPGTAREAIERIGRSWLQQAGVSVDDELTVEVGPRLALDAEELARRIEEGLPIDRLTAHRGAG